ncbi:response regulator [Pontibacter sp. G13]|uniref:response regulator n=1 Tax=Pontibacter sp. G13 TaxID=3074898 RepID=UPI00288C280C|nr:response regulator [Pontibacter sp. G13]WNJ17772.1 response regulator [Pontibacter sp. G13]
MPKILLIEDNPDMRENTAEILSLADYEVLVAENGKVGVSLAKTHEPDLIVCDVMMPELDGYGVLRMLSKLPSTSNTPFIFLTAKAESVDFRKGMSMGADDYITKPFDDVELLDAIELRLKKHQKIHSELEALQSEPEEFILKAKGIEDLKNLSDARQSRVYKAREVIYHEGSYPFGLLFIKSGKVRTYKTNEDAKEYVTGLLKAGDYLGYLPLLRDTPYEDSAMALEDTELMLIPKDDFFSLLFNNRNVASTFIRMLSDSLSEKEEELLHLAYDSVRKRVADALLHLRDRFLEDPQETFKMAVTREHLASLVGTSKECVTRVLSEFKEEGLVETHISEIRILKPEGLSAVRN